MAGSPMVCVTGAGGFIASWLVKLLLSRGYSVHGTVRDPSDKKTAHLKRLENAAGNLKIFKADLLDYDAMAAAVMGCLGVFHVATPVPSEKLTDPELQMLAPAVTGTTNVLRAASAANVQRVVVVSSIVAVEINPKGWPEGEIRDENCWSDEEFCRSIESWYPVAKIISEKAALEYGHQTGLDVVTVNPGLVFGPLLQPTVNASSQFLIYSLKGGPDEKSIPQPVVATRAIRDRLLCFNIRATSARAKGVVDPHLPHPGRFAAGPTCRPPTPPPWPPSQPRAAARPPTGVLPPPRTRSTLLPPPHTIRAAQLPLAVRRRAALLAGAPHLGFRPPQPRHRRPPSSDASLRASSRSSRCSSAPFLSASCRCSFSPACRPSASTPLAGSPSSCIAARSSSDPRESICDRDHPAPMTSEKLKKLGWNNRPLEETIADTVEFCQQAGFLEDLDGEDPCRFPPLFNII
ncbi:unnamed protein product [Urochloa humidicola]